MEPHDLTHSQRTILDIGGERIRQDSRRLVAQATAAREMSCEAIARAKITSETCRRAQQIRLLASLITPN